jgi:hypothetical protein
MIQVRVSLPSDRSFTSYEQARALLESPRLGVTFNDGIEVIAKPTDRQPTTAAA